MDVDLELGREPVQLALPVPEHRRRAHDQRRPLDVVAVVEQVGDHLDGLPEAHVVCEERPQAELARPHEPPQPDLLVRAQLALERLGRLERRDVLRAAKPGDELLELAGRIAHLDRHSAHLVAPGERRPERGHRRHRRAVERDRRQRPGAGERLAIERPPLAAQPHERLRRSGQRAQLLDADLVAAQRRPQVVADDTVERQRPSASSRRASSNSRSRSSTSSDGSSTAAPANSSADVARRSSTTPCWPSGTSRRRPVQRREHAGRPEQRRGRPDHGERPACGRVGRQVEPQLERRERVAQPHDRRSHAQVGRDGAEQRLEHAQIDPSAWISRDRMSFGSRTAAASACMLRRRTPPPPPRRPSRCRPRPPRSRTRTAWPAAGNRRCEPAQVGNGCRRRARPARRPGPPAARHAPRRSTAHRARSGGRRRRAASRGTASRPCDGCPPRRRPGRTAGACRADPRRRAGRPSRRA